MRSENIPHSEIQRRPKVVNGISYDEAKFLGYGATLFETYGGLSGFEIADVDEAASLLFEKFGYMPVQIRDVLIGPFKFHNSAAQHVERIGHG